jgi:putative tricarboxylic transport membrane protein
MDIISGQLRLTFGTVELMRGFSFVVAVIGLLPFAQIWREIPDCVKLWA